MGLWEELCRVVFRQCKDRPNTGKWDGGGELITIILRHEAWSTVQLFPRNVYLQSN